MSIEQTKFLGATVFAFRASGDWNEQPQQVYISLVEDMSAGDDFILKEENVQNSGGKLMGTPASFVMGGFTFTGLILAWDQKNDFNGNPTYEVVLTSVLPILEGTQVILSSYVGPVNDSVFNGVTNLDGKSFSCSNLLNVYGYLEMGGSNFGNAQENESGLLWAGENGVKAALETLTNTSPTQLTDEFNFGSYLKYRNHYYRLDLSGLPVPPSFYRIGGNVGFSLLELISGFCQDGGVDYMVKLTLNEENPSGPHTITFTTVDLIIQSTLGQMSTFLREGADISQAEFGQELRNDITQAFLVGGEVSVLQPMENWSATNPTVMPFWGFDTNGNPILGRKPDGTFFADDDHVMTLNASRIADIMGAIGQGLGYTTNILELRCALIDYDSWAAYLAVYKPTLATALGIYGAASFDPISSPKVVYDFIAEDIESAKSLGGMNDDSQWTTISQRVYEFVRDQAESYYGRQFLVLIPYDVKVKIIPETTSTLYNYEVTDAGFLPEASLPLGLNQINENYFLDQTGRYFPFLRFAFNANFKSVYTATAYQNGSLSQDYRVVSANPSILDSSAIIQPSNNPNYSAIYLKNYNVEIGPVLQNGTIANGSNIFFVVLPWNNAVVPAMVISLSSPVFAQAEDPLGGVNDLATILGITPAELIDSISFRSTSFPMKIHPPAIYPNGVAIAIKSNQFTYGPWGKFTNDGKVHFEQNTTLVPWEYGGYSTLNLAANAMLANVATGKQVQEKSSFTQAGLPTLSIGETMVEGGPQLSKIDVNISQQGITTSYIMESFVPRAGRFIRENADRLKRFGKAYQELRRAIRQLYLERNNQAQIINSYNGGFMAGASYAVQQKTPHAVLGAHLKFNPDGSGSYIPLTYTQTVQESVANVRANRDEDFRVSACMSLEGLLRPFSTNVNASGISTLKAVDENVPGINMNMLNPLQNGNDFLWFSTGETYSGLNNRKRTFDTSDARILGLRGPAMMVGWGFDIQGNPVPNISASGSDPLQNYSPQFKTNYLSNSIDWPGGAVDLRWDKFRSVWASPGMVLTGRVADNPISPGGSGLMQLVIGHDSRVLDDKINVHHFFSNNTLIAGTRIISAYSPLDNFWYIISADC